MGQDRRPPFDLLTYLSFKSSLKIKLADSIKDRRIAALYSRILSLTEKERAQLLSGDLLFSFLSFHIVFAVAHVVLWVTFWVPGLLKLALGEAIGVWDR